MYVYIIYTYIYRWLSLQIFVQSVALLTRMPPLVLLNIPDVAKKLLANFPDMQHPD